MTTIIYDIYIFAIVEITPICTLAILHVFTINRQFGYLKFIAEYHRYC